MKKTVLLFLALLLTFSLVFACESENKNVTATYSNPFFSGYYEYSWLDLNVDSFTSDSILLNQNKQSLKTNPQTTTKM